MCVNMARKSKVETSSHYNEIVELLVAGYSARYVSNYLDDKYNEKISHVALNNYKKNNLNVKAAVKKKIIEKEKEKKQKSIDDAVGKKVESELQAQETFEIAADYRFRDIQKLDDLISQAEAINIDLDKRPWDEEKYDPYKEQNLKLKMKKLGLDAIKLKYELVDEEELNVNVQNENIIGLAESIEKSRQKYLKETESK